AQVRGAIWALAEILEIDRRVCSRQSPGRQLPDNPRGRRTNLILETARVQRRALTGDQFDGLPADMFAILLRSLEPPSLSQEGVQPKRRRPAGREAFVLWRPTPAQSLAGTPRELRKKIDPYIRCL